MRGKKEERRGGGGRIRTWDLTSCTGGGWQGRAEPEPPAEFKHPSLLLPHELGSRRPIGQALASTPVSSITVVP